MSINKKKFVKILNTPLIRDRISRLREKDSIPALFRRSLNDIALALAYEISAELPTKAVQVTTPLEEAEGLEICDDQLLLISILRAGNGLLNQFLNVYERAKVGFIGLERQHDLKIKQYYCKIPKTNSPYILILDPMLASGHSALAAIELLSPLKPQKIIYCCLLAAPEGIKKIHQSFPDTLIYTACLDRELNEHGYILPGLGDAGDRIYNSF